MIHLSDTIAIDEGALEERFVRASGPGGQNVNKVATAVELRLNLHKASLPKAVTARLMTIAAKRISAEGILTIDSRSHRTQLQNRAAARERLAELIQRAARPPKKRTATRPTKSSRERRLSAKKRRTSLKESRSQRSDLVDD